MDTKKLVSIVITTKNEEHVIARLINSIKKQSYKNIETILVDNNSSDNTVIISKKLGVKTYNFGPERSAQRNFGVKKSKGKYFMILDADMELQQNVVKDCIELINKDSSLGGVVIPEHSKGKNFWEQVKSFERSIYNIKGDEITDAARFFTRESFNKVGGFDESITGPEDWDFPESIKKIGFNVGRIESLIYHHERIPSVCVLLKKKYYYALKSNIYFEKNNISVFSSKTIYFLRPVFYKNWRALLKQPKLSIGLIIMLTLEQFAGGLGYLIGRLRNK